MMKEHGELLASLVKEHSQIVRDIIMEEMRGKTPRKCSKYYVVEKLKERLNPTILFNAALNAGVATDDGVENMHRGAKAIFQRAMKSLKIFRVRRDGWIKEGR